VAISQIPPGLTHDVAITNLAATPPPLKIGETVYINVTIVNQGHYTENFNVSVYYTRISDPLIGTQNVTLASGAITTLTFEWIPEMTGRYEILANITEIPGEVDTADNTLTIRVRIGYSSGGSSSSESINGYHVVSFIFALFASVMVLAFRKNREMLLSDMPASILKQNLRNNLPNNTINMWQDQIRRQPI
jgi:hypothetical protein